MNELTITVVGEDELRRVHGGAGRPVYCEVLIVRDQTADAAILPTRVADRIIDIDI